MKKLVGLAILIPLAMSAPARAQASSEAIPTAQESARRDLVSTVALGAVVFGAGQAIALAHFFVADAPNRDYDFVPIAGPGVLAYHYDTEAWTSPLFFSSWLQAVGLVIAASAGCALAELKVHVDASIASGSGALTLTTRF